MSTSLFKSTVAGAALPPRPAYNAAAPPAAVSSTAPVGTFATGTKIQVGTHRVIIERYLSEGGFAHVYLVRLPKPIDGSDVAVLKRVAVPDKEALANMRTEVETMKKLRGHKQIVTYVDSHASQLKGGGYEVFLLMEYCSGGGLIDFMNTRLQNRLTEPEILHIFSDVAEGVACMHYLKPPLLHRDLKVENVLISSSGTSRRYKLCDFGSTAPPRPAATSATECRLIEDDVQKHTTLQYRSPEMVDVYRKHPIDEKSDVWALGVLLFKLCYYTTPFEDQGQLAILNASFKFPGYPAFSDRIKKLIASMLREKPQVRPNIYQILREVCTMRGLEIPIRDIYTGRSHSEARRNQQLPSPEPTVKSPPIVGAVQAPPEQRQQILPEIVPMRRGRPTSTSQSRLHTEPSPSPARDVSSDPFAALDSKAGLKNDATQDELSSRFPTLDQFSLLVDSGSKFEFEQSPHDNAPPATDLSRRVTERLADEAFAQSVQPNKTSAPEKSPSLAAKPSVPSKDRLAEHRPKSSHQTPLLHQPAPERPPMVSQGTMTSPSPSPPEDNVETQKPKKPYHFSRPSLRHRSSSQPRSTASDVSKAAPSSLHLQANTSSSKRPSLLESHRSRSHFFTDPKSPASSRPSLEGNRPSLDIESSVGRSKSANSRPRPSSVYAGSNPDYQRDRMSVQKQGDENLLRSSSALRYEAGQMPNAITGETLANQEETNIASNVEFLRAMEDEEGFKKKDKRASSGSKHAKRASLPSLSLSNTKSLFAGRFGDAFRRFESNTGNVADATLSPSEDRDRKDLTPITGSEVTGDRSDDEALEESAELAPEARRELERRRLVQEEQRVEAAATEYRNRMSNRDAKATGKDGIGGPDGGGSRATSIQNKVKSLLNENNRPSASKPGERQGRFTTDPKRMSQVRSHEDRSEPSSQGTMDRKHVPASIDQASARASEPSVTSSSEQQSRWGTNPTASVPYRPSAPPKPNKLRTGGTGDAPSASPIYPRPSSSARKPQQPASGLSTGAEDWEANFSKRYPSLSGLEMVETVIDKGEPVSTRSKEV
ncbi:MAG: hypothetical protein M1837_002960 [Sclerophora amabilis]|nr:MAG: hypothetical protein M1837_002960 [Sclerophora amabilis]